MCVCTGVGTFFRESIIYYISYWGLNSAQDNIKCICLEHSQYSSKCLIIIFALQLLFCRKKKNVIALKMFRYMFVDTHSHSSRSEITDNHKKMRE